MASTSAYDGAAHKNATASCPTGKVVIGTGHYVYGADGAIGLTGIAVNNTLAPTRVTVSAYEMNQSPSPGSWSVTAYAICAKPPAGLQVMQVATPFDSTSSKSVTANCPTGKVLTGTGFTFPFPTDGPVNHAYGVVVDDLRPQGTTPTAVTVTAYEAQPQTHTGSWYVRAQAICTSPLDGLVRVARSSVYDASGTKSITADCPAGSYFKYALLGSGYEVAGAYGRVHTTRTSPNGGGTTVPNQVRVTGQKQAGFAGQWSVTAYAICARQYLDIATP